MNGEYLLSLIRAAGDVVIVRICQMDVRNVLVADFISADMILFIFKQIRQKSYCSHPMHESTSVSIGTDIVVLSWLALSIVRHF